MSGQTGICHPEAKSKNLLGIKPHPPERHVALDQVRAIHIFASEHELVLAALLHIVPRGHSVYPE